MTQDKIEQINALARKARTVGLTAEEAALQKKLREEYVASVRASLESALERVRIVEPDGTVRTIRPKDGADTK